MTKKDLVSVEINAVGECAWYSKSTVSVSLVFEFSLAKT